MSNETTPKGIVSASTSGILPLAHLAKRGRFDSLLDTAAIAAVDTYQKYLSPHKGFSCAHRKLHGGLSCSQYFQQIVAENGLVTAIPQFQERLAACKLANEVFRNKKRRKKSNCDCSGCEPDCDLGDCGGCEPDCDLGDCSGCDNSCNIGSCDCGG